MKKLWIWLGWPALLLIWLTGIALALEDPFTGETTKGPVTIEADSISYDRENDVYHAQGSVNILFSGGTLKAQSVSLSKGANVASAHGQVIIRTDSDVLEGDDVVFNLTTNTGVVNAGKMFTAQNHFYLRGDKIEKRGEATYHIQCVSLTTCDGEKPDWRITGKALDLTVDGYGTITGGKFLAGDIPLLYLPYFLFPAKTTRQTGFLFPRLAYSSEKLGWDVELPFYVAVSKSIDMTFFQRYMGKRGFQEGVEFRYFFNKDSYGTIYGDYLHDTLQITEQKDNLFRDWQSAQDRWSFYFQSYTALKPDLNLRSDIALVSDPWYFKDLTSHNYYLAHYALDGDDRFRKVAFTADESLDALESKIRLVKDWPLYNLTALIDYRDDLTQVSNNATLQKYPEITLSGVTQTFFDTPLNFALNASVSNNYRTEGQKGELIEFKPTLSLPLDVGGAFSLIPQLEVRETLWDRKGDLDASNRQGSRTAYRFGVDATTSVFRDFTFSGGDVEKIRHEIKPELLYFYTPYFNQGGLPDFAETVEERNSLTMALTNTFLARRRDKDGGPKYWEILRIKLAQNYDVREARRDDNASAAPRRPFRNIDMEVDFKPTAFLSFYARDSFDVNSGGWEKANYDLELSDMRGDSAAVGYRYTRDLLKEINLYLKVAVTRNFLFSYDLRKNEFDDRKLRNALGFKYTRQCWSIGVHYNDAVDDRTVILSFSLNGLGQAGEISRPHRPRAPMAPGLDM